MCVLVLAQPR